MAGKIVGPIGATAITAATANGYVTIASVAGWYAGAKGAIAAAGQTNWLIEITEVITASNQLGVRFIRNTGTGPRYTRDNVAAYSGGTITMDYQLIFNRNDAPLS